MTTLKVTPIGRAGSLPTRSEMTLRPTVSRSTAMTSRGTPRESGPDERLAGVVSCPPCRLRAGPTAVVPRLSQGLCKNDSRAQSL